MEEKRIILVNTSTGVKIGITDVNEANAVIRNSDGLWAEEKKTK